MKEESSVVGTHSTEVLYAIIGARIRMVREALGFTQAQLAERTGLFNASTMSKLEKGRRPIYMHEIQTIAQALFCDPKRLLRGIWT